MFNFVKELRRDFPGYIFEVATTIDNNNNSAIKQLIINKHRTHIVWNIEKELEMVYHFGRIYHGILYEKVKDEVKDLLESGR